MSASERERHELAAKLEELLGPDQAATLMEHLPPMRWDALARQEDLLALRSDVGELRTDVDQLRTDVDQLRTDVTGLRGDVTGLHGDVGELRSDVDGLRGEMQGLRGEMGRTNDRIDHLAEVMELRFESLGDRITAHVAERVDTQTKLLVFSLLGAVLTATAIALGSNVL